MTVFRHLPPRNRHAKSISQENRIITVDLLVSILGGETGNLVLKVFATGGVYIAGGVALHLIEVLREPQFMQAFSNNGASRTSRVEFRFMSSPHALGWWERLLTAWRR